MIDEWFRDIPQQFLEKKKIGVLIKAFARQMQELATVFDDLNTKLDIETAVGQNLDYVGTIIPLSRKEAGELEGSDVAEPVISDDRYRQLLRYKNLVNTNECTYYDLMDGLSLLLGVPYIYYKEDPAMPATIILYTCELDGTVDTRPLFQMPIIRAAGVAVRLYVNSKTDIETSKMRISSGLGYAVTTTALPQI